jgi:hypothetical protein
MVRGPVRYTSDFNWLQRKKFMGMRSGDFGGHSIRPLRPIQPTISSPRLRNDVVVHRAESKTNVVLRVAFRTRVVPTHLRTAGDILRPSFSFREYWSQKIVFTCHEPHSYSQVSSVMIINYNMRVILRPVHGDVSADAHVSIETRIVAKHQMFLSDSLGFQHLTVCITSMLLFYRIHFVHVSSLWRDICWCTHI